MKKYLLTLAALFIIFGCKKQTLEQEVGEEQQDAVSVYFLFNLSTKSGASMTKASEDKVFGKFYDKIISGDLVAESYELTLTDTKTNNKYEFSGNWKDQDLITIPVGTYEVDGVSTASGSYIQEKCSLKIGDQITVSSDSEMISLSASYDCYLLIFSSDEISEVVNSHDGHGNDSFYSMNSYKYAFVNEKIYSDSENAYIGVTYSDGTEYKCYTGSLKFKKGKYYVYSSISGGFSLPEMDNGSTGENSGEEDSGADNEGDNGDDSSNDGNFGEDENASERVSINLPPDNEIWYTSNTGEAVDLECYPYELVANTYENGIGKYKFAKNVIDIGSYFSDKENPIEPLHEFSSITLPKSVTEIDDHYAMGHLCYASIIVLPPALTTLGADFIGGFGSELDIPKHLYFLSEEAPSIVSSLAFWNQSGLMYIHYPAGADYSNIKNLLENWLSDSGSFGFEYIMVETEYIIN